MAKPDDPDEPRVRFFSPMPSGYVFVPKGDVFITKNCRMKTHDQGQKVYVVVDKTKKVIGLRCPAEIYAAVEAESKATAERRAEAVQKRDATVHGKFERDILRLYPKTPEVEIPKIVKHALKKRSRRVGTRTTIDTDKKVGLAVRAHIRHCHTDYHKLLEETGDREASRKKIFDQVKKIEMLWGAEPHKADQQHPFGHKPTTKSRSERRPPSTGKGLRPNLRATKATSAKRGTAAGKGTREQTKDTWIEVDGVLELVDEEDAVETGSESGEESDWSEFSDF